jgi:hypothetical protein
VLYLDGHNNPGFSGGPIVFTDELHPGRKLKVGGVVSALQSRPADVYHSEQIAPSQIRPEDRVDPIAGLVVNNNEDIVIGYSIDHAVTLINASKIEGPLVNP